MVLLYLVGASINPTLLRLGRRALHALLRDAARYGVMAVGMTFVIVNKDLDLSVGSTLRPDRASSFRVGCSRRPIFDLGVVTGARLRCSLGAARSA